MLRSIESIKRLYATGSKDRSLLQSIVSNEVEKALKDWIKYSSDPGVLIGGLAVSYHAVPRSTMDIDIIFSGVPPLTVNNFKKIRPHAFEHKPTGVEIEVLTASFLNISQALVDKVHASAHKSDGMLVASLEGLISLKLQRGSRQDLADIETILKVFPHISLTGWPLSDAQLKIFNDIKNEH